MQNAFPIENPRHMVQVPVLWEMAIASRGKDFRVPALFQSSSNKDKCMRIGPKIAP